MKDKPLKRSEYLVALSRDHHAGLLFCWKIRSGLEKGIDPERLLKYVNFFWEAHLKDHFREEETLLFDHLDDQYSQQAKLEHRRLEDYLVKLNSISRSKKAAYGELAAVLVEHIRFEERYVFPYLQEHLSASVLKSAGKYLGEHHQMPFKDNFPDEFWKEPGVHQG